MKTVLVFGVLFVCFVELLGKQEPENPVNQLDENCLKQAKVDKDLIAKNLDDNFIMTEGNVALQNFVECVMKGLGGIDKGGELDFALVKKELMEKLIPYLKKSTEVENKEKIADDAIEKCKHITADSIGAKIIKFHNCVVPAIGH